MENIHDKVYNRALVAINKNYMKFDAEDVQRIKKYIDKMHNYTITKDDLVSLYDIIIHNIENFSKGKKEIVLRIFHVAFRDGIKTINDKNSIWALETFAWGLEK